MDVDSVLHGLKSGRPKNSARHRTFLKELIMEPPPPTKSKESELLDDLRELCSKGSQREFNGRVRGTPETETEKVFDAVMDFIDGYPEDLRELVGIK